MNKEYLLAYAASARKGEGRGELFTLHELPTHFPSLFLAFPTHFHAGLIPSPFSFLALATQAKFVFSFNRLSHHKFQAVVLMRQIYEENNTPGLEIKSGRRSHLR